MVKGSREDRADEAKGITKSREAMKFGLKAKMGREAQDGHTWIV